MHVAGKVFLGLGAVLLVIGIVMGGLGGSALEDVGDVDVEAKTVWSGQDGVFTYDGKDTLMVFVPDTVRCDEFTITFSNESGNTTTKMDRCTEDGSAPEGYADDPDGWSHMGTFGWEGEPTTEKEEITKINKKEARRLRALERKKERINQ